MKKALKTDHKLAGRLFSTFCMARSVHKIFTKKLALTY